MKVSVLSSGSKGNCTYVETKTTKILIDAGMSCSYIEKQLNDLGVNPNDINKIFITHAHKDHISGLKVFLKKHPTTVCLSEKILQEIDFDIKDVYFLDEQLLINEDLLITTIKTSHDTDDSNGYIFTEDNKSLVYITDTGYIHMKHHDKLKNKDMYIFESNHDVNMLMQGKYPYYLKQRILGDKGHLSNKDSAYYLSLFTGTNTKNIILAHLSDENNSPTIALETLSKTFEKKEKKLPNVIVAKQKESTELIEV